MGELHALAEQLRHPVSRRWLSLALAEAVILLVALRTRSDATAAVVDAEGAQARLRRAVAP